MCESLSLCCTCFEFDADILLPNHTGLCCPDIWLGAYSIPDLKKYQRTYACLSYYFSPSSFFSKDGTVFVVHLPRNCFWPLRVCMWGVECWHSRRQCEGTCFFPLVPKVRCRNAYDFYRVFFISHKITGSCQLVCFYCIKILKLFYILK